MVQPLALGNRAPAFSGLLGVDGMRYSLSDFDGKGLLLVIFSSNRCPTAKAYEDRMMAIQRDYALRGVQLVVINSNNSYLYSEESYGEMVKRANAKGYNFPYLRDEDQSVGKRYGALVTLHAFLFDEGRKLRYRGRIDDSRNPAQATTHDLRNALDDLLAGGPVSVAETTAFGCTIDYL